MNKQHAQNLARALASADLSGSSYELIDVDRSPVYRGGNHVGTFKFSRGNEPWLKLSVVVWLKGAPKEWYLVLADRNRPRLAELWEIDQQTAHLSNGDLIWEYAAKKQQTKESNGRRVNAFCAMAGDTKVRVSLPGADISVVDLLDDLFRLAAIRRAADDMHVAPITPVSFIEGRRIEGIHKRIERRSDMAAKAKVHYGKEKGQRWPCEVCGFEFGEVYGAMGAGYIEAHHNVDLSLLASESGHKSTLNDFKMLCSNCHRMVHTQRPSMSVEALKNALGTLN